MLPVSLLAANWSVLDSINRDKYLPLLNQKPAPIREIARGAAVPPKTKVRMLIFGLVLPYFAVAMYFVLRIQEHPLPSWFPYFGLSYLLGTIILVTAYSRRISRGT
jgi:hypothetical protein